MPAKTLTKVEQPKKLRQCCSDDLTVDKWRFKLKTIGGWQLWWKINPKCCFIFLGTRSLIIMYRDVSECIRMYRNVSGIGFLAENQARHVPIHSDTSRYVQISSRSSSRSRSKSPLFRMAAKNCLTDTRWLCKSDMVSTASPQKQNCRHHSDINGKCFKTDSNNLKMCI